MLARTKWEIAGAVAAVLILVWCGYYWLQEHDARMKADATVAANEQKTKEIDARDAVLKSDQAKRDADSAAREAALVEAVKDLKTPAQITPFVQKELAPAAPQPITINIPKSTPDNPTPNAIVSIPQADLPSVRDRLNKCDIDANAITTCREDSDTKNKQLANAALKLNAANNERDAYKLELAGGTFWRRTKTALKFVGIGAAAAGVAICGSGHCK